MFLETSDGQRAGWFAILRNGVKNQAAPAESRAPLSTVGTDPLAHMGDIYGIPESGGKPSHPEGLHEYSRRFRETADSDDTSVFVCGGALTGRVKKAARLR